MIYSDKNKLKGKLALVSVRYFDVDRVSCLKETKVYGTINAVNDDDGIAIRLSNREEEFFTLPAGLEAWHQAPAGSYEDESSGELITDPDYLVSWHVYRTQEQREDGDHEWWSWEPAPV